MNISIINNYNSIQYYPTPAFQRGGKTIDLKYILEKNSRLLPQRVKNRAFTILKRDPESTKSLLEIHREIYSPLLECTTLEKVKELFPEFSEILEMPVFKRNSLYNKLLKEKADNNFALKIIQDFWAKLKTKEEIAKDFGFESRNSLEWSLKNIGFVSYPSNYKSLLNASDVAGNKTIAEKTRKWNQENPEKRRLLNKHAAQACKTDEYRAAQSKRMFEYDIKHPERRKKIAEFDKLVWEQCPEIKLAMSKFAEEQSAFVRSVVMKKIKGKPLSEAEKRIDKGFYKRFWQAHPELKEVLSKAKQKIRELKKKEEL